jgi:hypothetical protein
VLLKKEGGGQAFHSLACPPSLPPSPSSPSSCLAVRSFHPPPSTSPFPPLPPNLPKPPRRDMQATLAETQGSSTGSLYHPPVSVHNVSEAGGVAGGL